MPQLSTSVASSTSQPSAAPFRQSSKPASQEAMPQLPAAQAAVAWAGAQAASQAPQWERLVPVSVSQPFPGAPSQSPQGGEQLPTPQAPAAQPGVPLATAGQAVPQEPQWAASVARATSQPSPRKPLQSSKPASQAPTAQAPPVQATEPLAMGWQSLGWSHCLGQLAMASIWAWVMPARYRRSLQNPVAMARLWSSTASAR